MVERVGVDTRSSMPMRSGQRTTASRRWRHSLGTVGEVARWVILIEFVYVFLFPLLYMLTTSVKTLSDLNNPSVHWLPRTPTLEGYRVAIPVMEYLVGLRISTWTSVVAALGQTLVGALVAYSFARVRFPGRNALFAFMLFTIVVPPQTIMIPLFLVYNRLEWTNTHFPLVAPAFMGWGVRGGILLIVYRQFFRGLPYELDDAARADGAGPFRTFWQIMLPLAKPAVLVVLVFSLTWTWNDAFVPWLAISSREIMTLPQRLEEFYWLMNRSQQRHLEPNVYMAACLLAVLPVLLVYVIAQRHFTQSIDRTGLVE